MIRKVALFAIVFAATFLALTQIFHYDDKVSAAPVRSTSRMALRPMIRTSPRVHMRSRMYVAKDDKMVPDKCEPDKDLAPRDGSFIDMVMNEWLCKASPTRSIVIDRQADMNQEMKDNKEGLWGLLPDLPSLDSK
ncbi:hypothetical protein AAMO2058_001029500 [Amorphochlora amoebiformis]|mmetsp:Transcript_29976/g.47936  ORF Transcript_29976/g.47936 Transcript_29976/m.47936 type:complete len:135 (-) Transcript_29976:206-610(-)